MVLRAGLGVLEKREISLPLPGSESQIVQSTAQSLYRLHYPSSCLYTSEYCKLLTIQYIGQLVSIISNGINFHYKETRRKLAVPVEDLCGFQAFFCETKNKRVLLGTTSFRLSVQPSVLDVVSAIISSGFHKIWYRPSLQTFVQQA